MQLDVHGTLSYHISYNRESSKLCPHARTASYYIFYVRCSMHGDIRSGGVDACSKSCAQDQVVRLNTKCSAKITQTCPTCNGVGTIKEDTLCQHGCSSSHWYCEHGNNQPENYHE